MTDWKHILNGAFPVQSKAVRVQMIKEDRCPQCGGELDTGWECNDCDFDGMQELPKSFTENPKP